MFKPAALKKKSGFIMEPTLIIINKHKINNKRYLEINEKNL